MKDVIVLEGEKFDWKEAERHQKEVVAEDGSVNWRAAFFADPGVMSCPECKVMFWREGKLVKCTECGHEWRP